MTPRKCYDCIWRETVPGSVRSSCHHPSTAVVHTDPFAQAVGMFGKRAGVGIIPTAAALFAAEELGVSGVPRGVAKGWFLWPVNYDPMWLESCTGFEPKPEDDSDVLETV